MIATGPLTALMLYSTSSTSRTDPEIAVSAGSMCAAVSTLP
jgi:hypothetical protein